MGTLPKTVDRTTTGVEDNRDSPFFSLESSTTLPLNSLVDVAITVSPFAALKEMLLPGGLAIVLPLAIGFWNKEALGGFLAGALVTGFLLAIFMANSGGAWDNAKKYIEAGGGAGKGSEEHKAAVIGDTIGDPFKDTSGPAMNIVIKVMTIVSLIFASAF